MLGGNRASAGVEATRRAGALAHAARLRLADEFRGGGARRVGRRLRGYDPWLRLRRGPTGLAGAGRFARTGRLGFVIAARQATRQPRQQPAGTPVVILAAMRRLLRPHLPLRSRRKIRGARHARLQLAGALGRRRDEVLAVAAPRVGTGVFGVDLRLASGDQRRIGAERTDSDRGIGGRPALRRTALPLPRGAG